MIQSPETAHLVHAGFEATAMFVGARYYFLRRQRTPGAPALWGRAYWVLFGCLLGAGLGNKLAFALEWPQLFTHDNFWRQLWSGQSMVGGWLGGLLGTELAKKLSGQTHSTGDLFVAPLLFALAIGRIGCHLAGLNDGTHGLPTTQAWGMDFGDGIARHPTQLYEIVFALALWAGLHRAAARLATQAGLQFKLATSAYLLWRLGIDTLKPVPFEYALGLSGIQWLCLGALALYLPLTLRQLLRLKAPT